MRFSEQTGYKLYDKDGQIITCPSTTVQGLISIAQKIIDKPLFAKMISENECLLFENLLDVAEFKKRSPIPAFRIYGEYKGCCG